MTADPAPRPMRADDVEAVDALMVAAFEDLERRLEPDPTPIERDEARVAASRARVARLQSAHGDDCWVVDGDERLAAASLALRSEDVWGLSLLVVDPETQSGGLGRAAMRASLSSAEGARVRLIMSSGDHRALRLYAATGHRLHPALRVMGRVDRARRAPRRRPRRRVEPRRAPAGR